VWSFLLGADLHETFPNGPQRCLRPQGEIELAEDVRDVGTRRSLADHQLVGDLAVALPRTQEAEDIQLTRRQLRVPPAR
jgi:hypothetical protein